MITLTGLNLSYRYRPGIGLEARHNDTPDHDIYWRVTLVPSVQSAIAIPGEIEKMIKARDEAVDEVARAHIEAVVDLPTTPSD